MEVRSETGAMASREPFTVGLQKSPVQQQQSSMQSMRLTFASDGTAIYKQVNPTSPPYQQSSGAPAGGASDGSPQPPPPAPRGPPPAPHHGLNMNMNMGEHVKRKRGRPRKYGPDGTMALVLSPNPMSSPPSVAPPVSTGGGGFSSPMGAASTNPASSPSGLSSPTGVKKARGRPPGSGKKQQMAALGSAGSGFTPHVLTVKAGEDVSSIIMSFLQNGPRAVCILSANGAISNVTLRQAATSGGTVTYEGRFEILSLSGSFLLSESGGQRSRTGGLSVSLAGPDGRVLGGGVAGLLTAASPVQVVVGSFIAEGKKEHKEANPSPYPGFGSGHSAGNTGPSSPPSRGTLSESSGGPGSPINQSTGGCNNGAQHGVSSMPWK